jgi:hypothetical protein
MIQSRTTIRMSSVGASRVIHLSTTSANLTSFHPSGSLLLGADYCSARAV